MAPRSGPSWMNWAGTSSGANGAPRRSLRSSADEDHVGLAHQAAADGDADRVDDDRHVRDLDRQLVERGLQQLARSRVRVLEDLGGGDGRPEQLARPFADGAPSRELLERGAAVRRAAALAHAAEAVADLARRAVRAVKDLAAHDDGRGQAGAQDQQDCRIGAAQAAPAQLGGGRRLHVRADRGGRRLEALAQERRQLQLLPARHVRRQGHAVLVDDPGAHRRHGQAAPAAVPGGGGEKLVGARQRALDRLDGAATGLGFEAVGLHEATVEGRRRERYLRASEVDAEHEVVLLGDSGWLRCHSGWIRHDR